MSWSPLNFRFGARITVQVCLHFLRSFPFNEVQGGHGAITTESRRAVSTGTRGAHSPDFRQTTVPVAVSARHKPWKLIRLQRALSSSPLGSCDPCRGIPARSIDSLAPARSPFGYGLLGAFPRPRVVFWSAPTTLNRYRRGHTGHVARPALSIHQLRYV